MLTYAGGTALLNREHAKRSRVRKKFLLESLQQSVHALQEENDKLKSQIVVMAT
jgi:hypothetical protein